MNSFPQTFAWDVSWFFLYANIFSRAVAETVAIVKSNNAAAKTKQIAKFLLVNTNWTTSI